MTLALPYTQPRGRHHMHRRSLAARILAWLTPDDPRLPDNEEQQ